MMYYVHTLWVLASYSQTLMEIVLVILASGMVFGGSNEIED